MDLHDLTAARVDDVHGNTFVFARRERERPGAGKSLEGIVVDHTVLAAQGTLELVPGQAIRKEGLGDAEGAAVVVAVQEPRGDTARNGFCFSRAGTGDDLEMTVANPCDPLR